ncbi:MAG: glycosyltransferase family 4 protein [Solirubrobacterales bacterium]
MRILQVHNTYREPGGEDLSVANEAVLLRAAGHEVRRHIVRNPEHAGATLGKLALAPRNRFSADAVVNAAGEFSADVVHVHNTWFSISPAVFEALDQAGFPTVFTLRNYRVACVQSLLFRDGRVCTDCVGSSTGPGIRHRCYRNSFALSAVAAATISLARRRRTWHRANRLIAMSESQRHILVEAGMPDHQMDTVPNAVLDPGPRTTSPARSNQLLFVGRLTPEKGVDLLLDAWQRLPAEHGFELVLIGDGPLRQSLRSRLPAGVEFIGWQDPARVREEMLGGRALLFPTRGLEPFGRGVIEAFAAGLPVLAAAHGGAGEAVAKVGPDWCVASDSAEDWAAAISRLTDDAQVEDADRRARQIYEKHYSPAIVTAALERSYARAIDDQGTRAGLP